MKYYSCKFLESGINFNFEHIKPCCSVFFGPLFIDQYKGEKISWKNIQEKRNSIREDFKNNKICEFCKKCPDLKYEDWDINPKIDFIHIYHWVHCNCGCVYCANINSTKGEFSPVIRKSDYYDLFPILKEMFVDEMIAENAEICFVGGEPTVLEEFDDIVDLFLANNPKQLNILSSGIRYSETIEKCFKVDKLNLIISLDSGSPETFLKIKKVPEFNSVVNNVRKYVGLTESASHRIQLKYIILEKLNDNVEEIEKFLQITKEININRVRLDIEYCHGFYKSKGKEIPLHFYKLFDYTEQRCKELNFEYETCELVNQILARGHY